MVVIGQYWRTHAYSGSGDPDIIRRHGSAGSAEARYHLSIDFPDLLVDEDFLDRRRGKEFFQLCLILGQASSKKETQPDLAQGDGGYSEPFGAIHEGDNLWITSFEIAVG